MSDQLTHHRAESSGIADISNVQHKVNLIHHVLKHACGVERVRLNVLNQKEATVQHPTTHI